VKKKLTFIGLLLCTSILSSQTAETLTELQTPDLDETSGLLYYKDKIITHNDDKEAKLYEVDKTTGNITRTVEVKNVTVTDWEDIAQDASYIYIGDIGNNFGNRTNLKIYKIAKSDYDDGDNIVTPEIISYSYADQNNFSSNLNNHNWDAEALISYGDKLLIFTKNWADKKTNVYSLPKNSGTYSANLESTYNTNGLITGADISFNEDVIYLTGYSSSEAPFMYTIHNIPSNSLDLFSGTVSEKKGNIVSLGNQVEGITLFEITPTKHRLYISNEKYTAYLGSIPFLFPAKLWIIEIDVDTVSLNTSDEVIVDEKLNISPNPFYNTLNLSKVVDEAVILDLFSSDELLQETINNKKETKIILTKYLRIFI